jgi:hypothetical protein
MSWILSAIALVLATIVAAVALSLLVLALRNALERRAERRRAILQDLVLSYLDETLGMDALLAALRRADRPLLSELCEHLTTLVRGGSLTRLRDVMSAAGVVEHDLTLLRQGRHAQRIVAANRLALHDSPDVVTALRAVLADSAGDLRFAAANTLAELGQTGPVRAFVATLFRDNLPASRRYRTLFRKLLANAKHEVAALLDSDTPDAINILVVYALGRSGDFAFAAPIAAAARGGGEALRLEAYSALAALGHPAALPFVEEGLRDPSWRLRAEAASCAGHVGLVETRPVLAALLDDSVWWVRFRAAEALYRLGETGRQSLAEHSEGRGPGASVAGQVLREQAFMAP